MPDHSERHDWDAAFDAAMGTRPADSAPATAPEPAPRGAHSVFDDLDAELDDLSEVVDEFSRLDAEQAPRFRATFRKLTSGSEFSADELAIVVEMASYSLTELGEIRVLERVQDDPMIWTVTYAVVRPGPMAEMMAGPVRGMMTAWRGRLPVPQVGLIDAEGQWLG